MSHVSTYRIQIQDVDAAILDAAVRSAAADVGFALLSAAGSEFHLTTGQEFGDVRVQAQENQGIDVSYDRDARWNSRTEDCGHFQKRVVQHYQANLITGILSQAGWRTNAVQGPIGQPFRIQMIS